MNARSNRERGLVQEDLRDPWQILVACVMLNRTTGAAVRPVLARFLKTWPSADRMLGAGGRPATRRRLAKMLRPLGLQNVKARRILAMSEGYARGDPVGILPGVGAYALDAWAIFVEGHTSIRPADRQLRNYLRRRRRDR